MIKINESLDEVENEGGPLRFYSIVTEGATLRELLFNAEIRVTDDCGRDYDGIALADADEHTKYFAHCEIRNAIRRKKEIE